ncbi:superoxide dismutase [Candidatus Woesebacteria bacterium]|nr:superoxide dismutase [Candidatus Woesebacteria bacterium]
MYQLPTLSYEYDALAPHIDAKTMEIHLTKHHQAYIDKLNAALEKYPELSAKPVETLVAEIATLPEEVRAAVRNHGGGHANHSLFWTTIGPNAGGEPTGVVVEKMIATFGTFAAFQSTFAQTATTHFGSGWAWLVVKADGTLAVYSLPNQDSPLMQGDTPILGLDVWEHAYYLNYQNRRPDYIAAFWQIVNWKEVERRLTAAQ